MEYEAFIKLVEKLNEAAEAYYTGVTQTMSDAEYDTLLEKVQNVATANGWSEADNLLNTVAAGYSTETNITHPQPMLSMDKVKTVEDLQKFVTKIGGKDYNIEPKLDGLAISLTYENGQLVSAATRGDGITGENVTAQILTTTIRNLPATIEDVNFLNIRGELYITHTDFETAQTKRVALGKPKFANPRNAVAGSIRNTKENYVVMSFAVYDIVGLEEETYTSQLAHAVKLGFKPAANLITIPEGTLKEQITTLSTMRASFDFPTDGIVIKTNNINLRKEMGTTEKFPRWAMAFKFEAQLEQTVVKDIVREVGRTGAISYVGVLKPVLIDGSMVSKVTLNNSEYIADKDIHIGDTVFIRKANDIIPEVDSVNLSERPQESTPYIPSNTCPKCEGELDKTSIIWRCFNPECSIGNAILYWGSTDIMNIQGLGAGVVEQLLDDGLINSIADLYRLTESQLTNMKLNVKEDGSGILFGKDRAVKLIEEIQKSKQQPLNRFLSGLGVRFLGRRFGRKLATDFGTIEAVLNATEEELNNLEGFGAEKTKAIFNGLKAKTPLIKELLSLGLLANQIATPAESKTIEGLEWVNGSTFVITGSIEGYNRNSIQEALEALGGKAQSAVSSKTGYLIVGENAGSKLAKAESLGVQIIQASEVISKLGM